MKTFPRLIQAPKNKSFFLFGARGTGKSSWIDQSFPKAIKIDLLDSKHYTQLTAAPNRLEGLIPSGFKDWVVLDEVQKIPALLDEVHRLIEKYKYKFVLLGSSARKLKRENANLLAGRALTQRLYPLTAHELSESFNLTFSLKYGTLPSVWVEPNPEKFLASYIHTYLDEEVRQEGFTRNIGAFARFLEAASFSQGSVLNVSEVGREAGVKQKVAQGYFEILEDILFAYRLPPFLRRAKRRVVHHPKFYFFDNGVFRTIRPKGPLDQAAELDGISLETLFFQELIALNEYLNLNLKIYYWRSEQKEVDFVVYGEKTFTAIEVKKTAHLRTEDFNPLLTFLKDYPQAKGKLFYGGDRRYFYKDIQIAPITSFFANSAQIIQEL